MAARMTRTAMTRMTSNSVSAGRRRRRIMRHPAGGAPPRWDGAAVMRRSLRHLGAGDLDALGRGGEDDGLERGGVVRRGELVHLAPRVDQRVLADHGGVGPLR